jgi:oligopeptidase B
VRRLGPADHASPAPWLADKQLVAQLEAESRAFKQASAHLQPLADVIEARRAQLGIDMIRQPVAVEANRQVHAFTSTTSDVEGYEVWRRTRRDAPWRTTRYDLTQWVSDIDEARIDSSWLVHTHNIAIVCLDPDGTERHLIRLYRLSDGSLLDQIENCGRSYDYDAPTQRLFYTTHNDRGRVDQARVRRYGVKFDRIRSDRSIFVETDPSRLVSLQIQERGSYVTIASANWQNSVWYCMNVADTRHRRPQKLVGPTGDESVQFSVVYHPDYQRFLVAEFRPDGSSIIMRSAPDQEPLEDAPLYQDHPTRTLEGIDWASGHVIAFERRHGISALRTINIKSLKQNALQLPRGLTLDSAYISSERSFFGVNASHAGTYGSTYGFEVRTGQRYRMMRHSARTFRARDTKRSRVWTTSEDGTRLYLDVLRHAQQPDRPAPCVLYVYGGFGIPQELTFNRYRLCLLEHGLNWALAHPRGGGEFGERWHHRGRGANLKRSIQDLIATADKLVDDGITTYDQLIVHGASHGGALAAAAVNVAPHKFGMLIAEVPIVDVYAEVTQHRTSLAAHFASEYINDPDSRAAIREFSPADNVQPAPYPRVLLTAGMRDVRVPPQGVLQYANAIRKATTSGEPVLMHVHQGGHLSRDDEQDRMIRAHMIDFARERAHNALPIPTWAQEPPSEGLGLQL